MSLPNRSTKLKVAFGYILLTALLFISIGYIYQEMKSLTGTSDDEAINECGFRPLLPLLFRRCDAGHPDEGEETVLCAEEDGYTSAGGNGAAVLLFLVLSLREL